MAAGLLALQLTVQVAVAQIGFVQEGNASYYADRFHGKRTSSGERYDQMAFTAAHRELPFGCMVKVTNLENNLSVVVRINDRGPFKRNRVLDLSLAGAQQLDMVRNGIAHIRLEVVGVKDPPPHPSPAAEAPQAQAGRKPSNAAPAIPIKKVADKPLAEKAKPKPAPAKPKTENKPEQLVDKETEKIVKTFKPGNQEPNETPDARPTGMFPDGPFRNKGTYNLWGTIVKYESYCVQVGSFDNLEKAKLLGNKAKAAGYTRVYIQVVPLGKGITEYKVVLGVYDTKDQARLNIPELQKKGFAGFVSRHI